MVLPVSEWVTREPSIQLRPYVDRYMGYRLTGFAPGTHRGLPSRDMTFIVSVGHAIDVAEQTNPSETPRSYRALVSGLHASPALISHRGDQEGVEVSLSPLGSRALFGAPAGALWNSTVELADVVGNRGEELWERVQAAEGWDQRFAAVDSVLTSLLTDTGSVAPEVSHAWKRMVEAGGRESIEAVADSVGWSRQHLRRRFRSEFGLSPKLAARVLRFSEAVRTIAKAPSAPLADVALSCGYSDQSHMTNEFVLLGGSTPGRIFAGENVPKLQDAEGPAR